MNPLLHKVIVREKGKNAVITAPLEFDERQRPFLVLYQFLKRGELLLNLNIPLDPKLLQKINPSADGVDYSYAEEIEIPSENSN